MKSIFDLIDERGNYYFRLTLIVITAVLSAVSLASYIPKIIHRDFQSWESLLVLFASISNALTFFLIMKNRITAGLYILVLTHAIIALLIPWPIHGNSMDLILQLNSSFALFCMCMLISSIFLHLPNSILVMFLGSGTIIFYILRSNDSKIIEALQYWIMAFLIFCMISISAGKLLKAIMSRLNQRVEENNTLLKEIHHRIKNNLQMISSLINLHPKAHLDETYNKFTSEIQSRINAISHLHDLIYKSGDSPTVVLSAYLHKVWDTFQRSTLKISQTRFDFEDFVCDWEKAMTMGMIFSELAANIVKHSDIESQPRVNCLLKLEDGTIRFEMSNSITKNFHSRESQNLGHRIIESLLKKAEGRMEIIPENEMIRIRIFLPL